MNQPINTVNDSYDDQQGISWWKLAAVGGAGYAGGKWWLKQPTQMTTAELAFLGRTFEPLFGANWPSSLGYKRVGNKWQVTNAERALNWVKSFEEGLGGLLRTLNLYSAGVNSIYSGMINEQVIPFTIEKRDLRAFRKYYEALAGRKLTEEEMRAGLALGTYFEDDVRKVGLFVKPGSDDLLDQLRAGYHNQTPLVKDARLELRAWEMGGVHHLPSGCQVTQ